MYKPLVNDELIMTKTLIYKPLVNDELLCQRSPILPPGVMLISHYKPWMDWDQPTSLSSGLYQLVVSSILHLGRHCDVTEGR